MRERRIALVALTAVSGAVGAWALFAPASFHASFPFGRGWVALEDPFAEHLLRDVGALNLALATLAAEAARRMEPSLIRLTAIVTLVFAVPHLVFHATHTDHYPTGDAIANVATLTGQVLVLTWLAVAPGPATHRSTAAVAAGPADGRA